MNKGIIKRLFSIANTASKLTRKDLVRREAQVGKQLFGTIPAGQNREFFYLGDHTWVWHEAWRNADGKPVNLTTRYEVHTDRIVKVQDGQPNRLVEPAEATNLLRAIQWYYHYVSQSIYAVAQS